MNPLKLCALSCLILIPTISKASWTGFYLGGNVGGAFSSSNAVTSTIYSSNNTLGYFSSTDVSAINAAGNQNLKLNAFLGGMQTGFNFQLGSFLLGLKVNLDSMNQTSTQSIQAIYPNSTPESDFNLTQKISTTWLLTADPQIGYVIGNNFLIYITGGLAMTDIDYNETFTDNYTTYDVNENSRKNQTMAGWATGAGIEWKFFPKHWSLGAEYLYTDFGNITTSSNNLTDITGHNWSDTVFDNKASLVSQTLLFNLTYSF